MAFIFKNRCYIFSFLLICPILAIMPDKEFKSQLNNLLQRGYSGAAGITEKTFTKIIAPLEEKLRGLSLPEADSERGELPFVIVIKQELVSIGKMMEMVNRQGKNGVISMAPVTPEDFTPIKDVIIPESPAYLAVDIDRGRETLNVRPEDALKTIRQKGRSPLTIEEGIAIITQYPDFLKKNNCFSLLASRRADQRVPALWISERRPKLGWCWGRNPHTWLGSASCGSRVGY